MDTSQARRRWTTRAYATVVAALHFAEHTDHARALAAAAALAVDDPGAIGPRITALPLVPPVDALRRLLAAASEDESAEAAVAVQVSAAPVLFGDDAPERVRAAAEDERARQQRDRAAPPLPPLAAAPDGDRERAVALTVRIGVRLHGLAVETVRPHDAAIVHDLELLDEKRRTAFGFWMDGLPKFLAVAEGRITGGTAEAVEARARIADIRTALTLLHIGVGVAADYVGAVGWLLGQAAATWVALGGDPATWAADVEDIGRNGLKWVNRPDEDWKRFEAAIVAIQSTPQSNVAAVLGRVDELCAGLADRLEGPPETRATARDILGRADEVVRRVAVARKLDPELARSRARAGTLRSWADPGPRALAPAPRAAPESEGFGRWGVAAAGGGVGVVVLLLKVGLRLVRVSEREAEREIAAQELAVTMVPYQPTVSDGVHQLSTAGTPVRMQPGHGPMIAHLTVDADGKVINVKAVNSISQGVVLAAERMRFTGGAGEFDVTWSDE